ncbi:TIGR03619 family F420-dependent LLM class oxidoreductase [Nakamurella lactea]|uniref:TIGR03619 family F420-dependent LLM class oxidoreductase n=1 Tax=Nakamurella lactea TaxID=459515 RepID=UPI0003FFC057|nr:TIGR03619 family F420-dependent LLM class oxidoreductase [Nakamurella lactea]
MSDMQFSVQFFGLPADQYLPLAIRAEQLGFHTLWLADHVVTPLDYDKVYPYNSAGDPGYRAETPLTDVAVTLGFLAGRTERIRLGAGVFVLPMRNPFHVARSFAALQNLSGGRLTLGLGTGWMREEFEAVGVPFRRRGDRTDEMLEVLDLLWSGRPVEYHGKFIDFPSVHFAGAPEQPIPYVFGGHSPAALRRAARVGSGWFGPNLDLAATAELTGQIDAERGRLGRTGDFTHYVRLVGDLTPETVDRYAGAGFRHLVFAPFNRPDIPPTLAGRLAALDEAASGLGLAPAAVS